MQTEAVYLTSSASWMAWLDLPAYKTLPWSTVALIRMQAYYKKKDVDVCIGWTTFRIFGHNDRVRHGSHRVRLRNDELDGEPDALAPTFTSEDAESDAPLLSFELEILTRPGERRSTHSHQ